MNQKLVLIRHAETTAGENILVGLNDLPLSAAGIDDAKKLKQGISIKGSVQYFCSTLSRARQTAVLLFPDAKFQFDERVNEIDFGIWSGLNIEEVFKNFPVETGAWRKSPLSFRFPSGESVTDFISRTENFVSEIISRFSGTTILVCHGGVIRFIMCHMLNLDYRHNLAFQIKKPSINLIDHDGKVGVLSGLNLTQLQL